MTNAIGIISMFYARPFAREHLPVFERVKAAGCDFIELLVPEPGELDLSETRAALADHELGVVLAARVNLFRDLSSPDAEARAAGRRYLEFCIESAEALGARLVGGPLYGAPLVFAGRAPVPVAEGERTRKVENIVEGLAAVAGRAGDCGIRLCIEPLNRFETDLANTTEHVLSLIEAVASPHVGLMLDTFHMNMEERSLIGAIRRAGSRLFHFQANENDRGFVGSGHLDWAAICRALADIGYEGPITLEPFRRDGDQPGTPLAQWRPPHRDEDHDLLHSVNLLRALLHFSRRGR